MKKYVKYLVTLLIMLVMVFSLAACGNENTPPSEETPGTDEPFGITQRPNDLEEYEDLRPDRQPYVDNAQPDTGELVDHIYEFEEMNASGTSQGLDHLCNSKSFMFSPDFSGYIALEAFDGAVKYTLSITSDKEVRIPMDIRMSNAYTGGNVLSTAMSISNNGHDVADTTVIVPTEGEPAEGAPGGYFNMVTVESQISLVAGVNRISFTCNAGTNLDYVNFRTSAQLVNNTVSSWTTPVFTVKAEPSSSSTGLLTVKCTYDGCTEQSDKNLPALTNDCYDVEDGEEGKIYSVTILGQKVVVAVEKEAPSVPEDTGELKDNFFEFENAQMQGASQNVSHMCVADSAVFCADFSGNVCVENISSGTTFTFVVESDKTVRAPFVFGSNNSYFGNSPLSSAVSITVNGESNAADLTQLVPTEGQMPDLGGISGYFNMVEVPGSIVLSEGENVIEITTKGSINLDYFNIRTSAELTDKTVSHWSGSNAPSFNITKAPTETEKGTLQIVCPVSDCPKGTRDSDLPMLTDEYIVENGAGETVYSLMIMGKKVTVARIKTDNEYPDDTGIAADNYFEFEKAQSSGHIVGSDHLCAASGFALSPDFSGNICVENIGESTTFTFVFDSDKKLCAPFFLGISTENANGKPLSELISVTNNSTENMADLTQAVSENGTPAEGATSGEFDMVNAQGKINLVEGENRIEITVLTDGINLDYLNIRTSAVLEDKTVSSWSAPSFTVETAPAKNTAGVMTVTCGNSGCTQSADRYLPALTSDCYAVTEGEGGVKTYSIALLGNNIAVATEVPSAEFPDDTGDLIDNYFEFEEAEVTGSSKIDSDPHMCAGNSFVYSPDFSGGICIENVNVGSEFTFVIESDKAVRAPFYVGLSCTYLGGKPLGDAFTITNNSDESLVDVSYVISTEGTPAQGTSGAYFKMVAAEGTIDLVKGENRITFVTKVAGNNFDYFNIRTSATLTDKTVSGWDTPVFTVKTQPSESQSGVLEIACGKDGCEIAKDNTLPALTNECYTVETDSVNVKTYTLTVLGQKITASTVLPVPEVPEDTGELTDNYFQFEQARIDGRSQDVAHVCPGNSLVLSPDFGGNLCMENIGTGTKFTFVIESDKAVKAPIVIGISTANGAANKPLNQTLSISNNGQSNMVDISANVPDGGEPAEGAPGGYFNMVTASGSITLVEGENIIEITTLAPTNIDYLNIRTSANLTDNTQSYFSEQNTSFNVTKAPTENDKGSMQIICSVADCTKSVKDVELPVLGDSCYTLEEGAYYIELLGMKVVVYDSNSVA